MPTSSQPSRDQFLEVNVSVSELKRHMQMINASNLFALSHHFNTDPDMLRDMLGLLIRKGIVRKCMQTTKCGTSCNRCNPLLTEIYEWVR